MAAVPPLSARPYHVVVWGASGFTGRLVAEHLSRDYKGGEVKWALAGRSRERLEALRLELSQTYGAEVTDVPILTADLADQSSLDALASSTRVVLSTAGPFLKIGTPLVDAAVRNSSHYVDITGEVPWVKQIVEKHQEAAAAKGLRIVPCCGYDSIPSDLGALLVVDRLRELGKQTARVVSVVMSAKGGVSGGTIASGLNIAEEAKRNPGLLDSSVYALVPQAERGKDKDFWGVEWNEPLKRWLAPFVMQVCNSRVVHRSNYFLKYGPDFRYQENVGAKSWLQARVVQLSTLAILGALSQPWLHPLVKKLAPAPGEGPSREAMLNGHFRHAVLGYSAEEAGAAPTVVRAEVSDPHRDAGYWGTSRMLLEAALTLALQQGDLDKDARCVKAGVLTPASAMGPHLIRRLRAAGLTLEVKEA